MFHREGKRTRIVRDESKRGASLVIVVCVSAFLVAFALAMVYTAGLMLSGANQRLKRERCFQLARSFARTLDQELWDYESTETAGTDSFYLFVCNFLEDSRYAIYNPDHPESTVYHYSAGQMPAGEDYGDVTVALYKEGERIEGSIVYDPTEPNPDPLGTVAGSVSNYTLTVAVTAAIDGESYTYSTVYLQSASYHEDEVIFTNGEGTELRWDKDNRRWLVRSTGNPYTAANNEMIGYEIQPRLDRHTGYRFQKTIPEKGEEEDEEGGGP